MKKIVWLLTICGLCIWLAAVSPERIGAYTDGDVAEKTVGESSYAIKRLSASSPDGGYCTPTPGDLNGNGANEEYLIALAAGIVVFIGWRYFRRNK